MATFITIVLLRVYGYYLPPFLPVGNRQSILVLFLGSPMVYSSPCHILRPVLVRLLISLIHVSSAVRLCIVSLSKFTTFSSTFVLGICPAGFMVCPFL